MNKPSFLKFPHKNPFLYKKGVSSQEPFLFKKEKLREKKTDTFGWQLFRKGLHPKEILSLSPFSSKEKVLQPKKN